MKKNTLQLRIEQIALGMAVFLLAFLCIRNFVLAPNDWNLIRGPLAPKHYYRLGVLDEPITDEDFLQFNLAPMGQEKELNSDVNSATESKKEEEISKG